MKSKHLFFSLTCIFVDIIFQTNCYNQEQSEFSVKECIQALNQTKIHKERTISKYFSNYTSLDISDNMNNMLCILLVIVDQAGCVRTITNDDVLSKNKHIENREASSLLISCENLNVKKATPFENTADLHLKVKPSKKFQEFEFILQGADTLLAYVIHNFGILTDSVKICEVQRDLSDEIHLEIIQVFS